MNYLLVEELSKSYGEKELFSDITFGIDRGQKMGLIARNGKGKTTLLEIIAGKAIPDAGKVVVRKGIRMFYLAQDPQLDANIAVLDAVLSADTEQAALIRAYERVVAIPPEEWDSSDHDKFDKLNTRLTELDAWHFESTVKEVLGKLNISDFDQPCGELSGGQQKKVALAKVLVEDADLLILDEPTNHLDIDTIEWMEEFLSRSQLSLLLVTHDRYFLDQTCDSIIELDRGALFHYRGDYQYYLEKKAEGVAETLVVEAKQKALYKKELEWMRRMPKARGTKAKSRIQEFSQLEDKVGQHHREKGIDFFVKMERLGSKILEINNIHKRFGDIKIVEDFSYIFKKGDKVGLVGKNGVGKSTFLDLVMGLLKCDQGRVVIGQTVKMAYFTQRGLNLDESRRVIDIVKDVAEEVYVDDKHSISASRFLTMFGIDHDIQYNYAVNLSGGERRKLHLLMALMEQPNFLILDEPTNDLDIQTLQALESFLEAYKGCLMVASHDRFFLDKIAGHLFVFQGEGKVKDYYGNYSVYRKRVEQEKKQAAMTAIKPNAIRKEKLKESKSDDHKPTWKELKEFEILPDEIVDLELRKEEIGAKLNSGITDHDLLWQWSEELADLMLLLDQKMERWVNLSEKIEG